MNPEDRLSDALHSVIGTAQPSPDLADRIAVRVSAAGGRRRFGSDARLGLAAIGVMTRSINGLRAFRRGDVFAFEGIARSEPNAFPTMLGKFVAAATAPPTSSTWTIVPRRSCTVR